MTRSSRAWRTSSTKCSVRAAGACRVLGRGRVRSSSASRGCAGARRPAGCGRGPDRGPRRNGCGAGYVDRGLSLLHSTYEIGLDPGGRGILHSNTPFLEQKPLERVRWWSRQWRLPRPAASMNHLRTAGSRDWPRESYSVDLDSDVFHEDLETRASEERVERIAIGRPGWIRVVIQAAISTGSNRSRWPHLM